MIKTVRGTQEESAKIKQAEKLYNKLQLTREQIKEVIARNISDEEWIIYLATNSICPPSLDN
jgi:outer membrane protein assembly factor BamD (BamD/ComL family)